MLTWNKKTITHPRWIKIKQYGTRSSSTRNILCRTVLQLEQFTNRAIVHKPKHSHVNGKSHFGTSIFLVAMSLRSWKAAPAPVTWSSRWNASNILHTWKVPSPPQLAKGKIMCHIIFPSKIHLISYPSDSYWFSLRLLFYHTLPTKANESHWPAVPQHLVSSVRSASVRCWTVGFANHLNRATEAHPGLQNGGATKQY